MTHGSVSTKQRMSLSHCSGAQIEDTRYMSESATEKEMRIRIEILEAALSCVREECEMAHLEPTIAMTTICRIDAVSRQALTASRLTGVTALGYHAKFLSRRSRVA
jgi:hypothetical protein